MDRLLCTCSIGESSGVTVFSLNASAKRENVTPMPQTPIPVQFCIKHCSTWQWSCGLVKLPECSHRGQLQGDLNSGMCGSLALQFKANAFSAHTLQNKGKKMPSYQTPVLPIANQSTQVWNNWVEDSLTSALGLYGN